MRVPIKKISRLVVLLFVSLFVVWAMGCRDQEGISAISPPQQITRKQNIRIGLIPEQNLFYQKKRYEPLAAYISHQTGITIKLEILSEYGDIIDQFNTLGLDGAFLGSFTSVLAQKKLGVTPCARPVWVDGTSTYYGLIFVRKDSDIRNGADMKGKRFAFVDKATTAGWLLPMYYFKIHGIDDYRSFFQETYFTGTHEGAIYDVLEKKADIGAAKNTVFYRLAAADPRITQELTILATSPDVPSNGLCFRSDLDGLVKRKIKETLVNMDRDEVGKEVLKGFGAVKFIETAEKDYSPVLTYAAQIGLDLKNYNYLD